MAKKNDLTPQELYVHNQKKAKTLSVLAPICFWGFLALAVMCLVLAVENSFGNVAEIVRLLNSKKYTGEELQANYAYLTEKYGEWVIGNGNTGFQIVFVNVRNALFSGVMKINCVLCIVFFISAYLFGKVIFPKLSKQIIQDNQDMVNLTILKDKE